MPHRTAGALGALVCFFSQSYVFWVPNSILRVRRVRDVCERLTVGSAGRPDATEHKLTHSLKLTQTHSLTQINISEVGRSEVNSCYTKNLMIQKFHALLVILDVSCVFTLPV